MDVVRVRVFSRHTAKVETTEDCFGLIHIDYISSDKYVVPLRFSMPVEEGNDYIDSLKALGWKEETMALDPNTQEKIDETLNAGKEQFDSWWDTNPWFKYVVGAAIVIAVIWIIF